MFQYKQNSILRQGSILQERILPGQSSYQMYLRNILVSHFILLLFIRLHEKERLKKKKLFTYLAVLGLCCCMWALSRLWEWGLLSSCDVHASRWGGFSCCKSMGSRVLKGSAVVTLGLRCPLACEIEPLSPALAGRFLTTGPSSGKSPNSGFFKDRVTSSQLKENHNSPNPIYEAL